MELQKRKIAVAVGDAEQAALETVYKTLVEHQILDHLQVVFFPSGMEGLQKALEEVVSGFDALIVMPLEGVNVPEIWRQEWSALSDSLQVFSHGNLHYIKLHSGNNVLSDGAQITKRIEQFSTALKSMFSLHLPRLAVMSTSKTSDGKMTKEDKEFLLPAIQQTFEKLLPVFGTFSSEVFFSSESYLRFDGFCFVNQEQINTMSQQLDGIGVMFEADAPIVLATPVTTEPSMDDVFRETLYLVNDVLNSQKEYAEISKNPLKFELKRENNEFQAF